MDGLPAILRHPRVLPSVAAVASLAGAAVLAGGWRDERHLERANAAGRAGDYERAIVEAERVRHDPARARALVTDGYARLALGDARAAARSFGAAAEAAPNDWEVRRAWAMALLRAGNRAAAARQLARASALNPGLALPPTFVK